MTKIGVIGFGGGSALIPVMEKELVRDGLLTSDEFTQDTVIANITPGALPVKLAALSAVRVGGVSRAVGAAIAVAAPGTVATVALLAVFAQLGPDAIRTVEFASLGVTAFILYLLGHYIVKVLAPSGRLRAIPVAIAVASFLATGAGKTLNLARDVHTGIPSWRLPELSALEVILISLVAISVVSLWQYFRRGPNDDGRRATRTDARPGLSGRALRAVGLFTTVTGLGVAGALLMASPADAFAFLGLITASTITSFGGGEAYVGVAAGFFVAPGIVDSAAFYGQIVPIANALPGPILVKVAAGTAFATGGWGLALASTIVAIAACSALAVAVLAGYDRARDSLLVRNVSTYVLPIICGLLASTAVSMLHSNTRIGGEANASPVLVILASLAAALVVPLIHKFVKIPDIIVIVLFGTLSWLALSALS